MHNFYDALPSMPAVGLQRGMDLWGDNAAFCQITLTFCQNRAMTLLVFQVDNIVDLVVMVLFSGQL